MLDNNNEKKLKDVDDSNVDSSDLSSENEDDVSGLEIKDKSKTGKFLLQNKEICKRGRFFSEDLYTNKVHQNINSLALENIKQSLKYLKNLEKEEMKSFRKFTLSSSSSH